ncbi:MAG: flagellar capping protein, partial [Ruminiclostridium sp.]|nr:flagellar capping protein [Ruminiclostridium sp.]
MANATSALRMSGMNSGLDTEAIVNALTATTKNKINTNERKVLKLQAQQEAYRSVITAFTTFQNKYFNMLNLNTCLKSGSLFNSYKGTLSNANGTNVNGVTVSSAANANEAVYNVDVHKVATQSTLKSASASGKSADLSQCTDNT